MKMLNIGCGDRYDEQWVNIDIAPVNSDVIQSDFLHGVPYEDEYFDVIYCSHVIEHVPKSAATKFVAECIRILRPGGIIRLVVPDLEQIVLLYIKALKKSLEGDVEWEENYEWIMLELYDQVVREKPGGAMAAFILQKELANEEFVKSRAGVIIDQIRRRNISRVENNRNDSELIFRFNRKVKKILSNWFFLKELVVRILLGNDYKLLNIARFRDSGEIHKWMYDRYSLSKLLTDNGFLAPEVKSVGQSGIKNWEEYSLETEDNGEESKPDSLYIEAQKPD